DSRYPSATAHSSASESGALLSLVVKITNCSSRQQSGIVVPLPKSPVPPSVPLRAWGGLRRMLKEFVYEHLTAVCTCQHRQATIIFERSDYGSCPTSRITRTSARRYSRCRAGA